MSRNLFCTLDLPFELKRDLGSSMAGRLGDWIGDHPQETIDALVEAGVLRQGIDPWLGKPGPDWYCVVQPHKHEWEVHWVSHDGKRLTGSCECGQLFQSPSRLPIEVPE